MPVSKSLSALVRSASMDSELAGCRALLMWNMSPPQSAMPCTFLVTSRMNSSLARRAAR